MKKTLDDYREFIFQEFCQEKFLQWFMQGIAMVKARPGGLAPEDIREEICEAQFREHFEKSERELCHRFWQFLPAKAEQMLAKYGAEKSEEKVTAWEEALKNCSDDKLEN